MGETVTLVRQQHSHECGIACMAMVMGVSIDEARAAFDRVYPGMRQRSGYGITQGIIDMFMDAVLAEEGYAVARLWHGSKDNRREPWPPEPFADVHIAQAFLANGAHYIVLLADGTVLDPASPALRQWTEYTNVIALAAVVPVRAAATTERGEA